MGAKVETDVKKKVMVIDTETNDRPVNWEGPSDDVDNWPRIVEIAWLIVEFDDNEYDVVSQRSFLIRPTGWQIVHEARDKHGITLEKCRWHGRPIVDVLEQFQCDLRDINYIVSHNIEFDRAVIRCETLRIGHDILSKWPDEFCTSEFGREVCRIRKEDGDLKHPNLGELHQYLLGQPLYQGHRAMVDAEACLRCLVELRKRYGVCP